MSDFKGKMHKNSISPDPLAVFKGPTSKGREEERKRKGRGR